MSDESTLSTSSTDNDATSKLNRSALLDKARKFLLSPDVRNEDDVAKRKFLIEKGLTDGEIDTVLEDLPPQAPPIPPRTYPPPPPSNLPVLLASSFRIMTLIAGASGILLFGYYRFLLPRLIRSVGARHRLKLHQSKLLKRLRGRICELRETQTQAYESLLLHEHKEFPPGVKSLVDLPANSTDEPTHNLTVVVHCAFLGDAMHKLSLEELYQRLLARFPGLKAISEVGYKDLLLRELERSRSFEKSTEGDIEYWSLRQGPDSDGFSKPIPTASAAHSLESLRDAVLTGQRKPNLYQHTFKSLTDLTAYLSRETYKMYGANTGFRYGLPGTQPLGPAEEDFRREVRALKGLVLNRRTFASSPYRPSLTPSPSPAVDTGQRSSNSAHE